MIITNIISFAMLTSKPPFQSSTTDEIYRRARERDYEWPSGETSQKFISSEAKDLVATMLQDADKRPEPDTILEHEFFTSGYMPVPADITSRLRDVPPENPAFYHQASSPLARGRNLTTLQTMCTECGVGPWLTNKMVFKNIWREMADEEQYGLTPAIPLAEGIVYRPFDEIRNEQRLQDRLAKQAQAQQSSHIADRTDDLSNLTQSAFPPKPPSGLLRAPPQSFAAQQRAQNRPPAGTLARSQSVTENGPRLTDTLRSRARRELPSASQQAREVPTSATGLRLLRNQLPVSKTQPMVSRVDSDKPEGAEMVSLFSPAENIEQVTGTKPDAVLDRLTKLQAEIERALNARTMALVSSKDKTPAPPHIVVKWVDYTNKFGLGYILNDGSVGCILKGNPAANGDKEAWLPPACLLVHGAERHCMRKDDRTYQDRHQVVPMTEDVYFYENSGEDGFTRVSVNPRAFGMSPLPDGSAGKLSAGKDIWDHRKRERIVLWKKFANYMVAYGRESEGLGSVEESPMRASTLREPNTPPSDVVTFYQRFGDVGCWMFCDGHMQVCYSLSTLLLHECHFIYDG